jgi:hypothetical protein
MASSDDSLSPKNHRVYKVKSMNNSNMVGLVERIDESLVEMLLSTSASVNEFREADQIRINTYFTAWETLVAFMAGDPELDSPQTSPQKVPVVFKSNLDMIIDEDGQEQPIVQDPENKALRDLTRDMRTLMGEMALSNSRRLPNGISPHDEKRFVMHLSKMRSYMSQYVGEVTPLDLPETSPAHAESGHGYL